MTKWRWLILFVPLAIFTVMVVVLLRGLGSDPRELESTMIGKPIPAFQLPDLYQPDILHDQGVLQGRPMLLNVWATWCPTCRAEHQYLNKLAQQGVYIVGLNYKDDSRAKAIDWLNTLGDPYQLNLMDLSGQVALDLGVYGAPETFLIDSDGIVRYRHVGDVNPRVWEQDLGPKYQQLMQQYESEERQ
ncbi:DsbE family thiol:disulfide interchange protein [Idiomarina tyrosinivorans]|uniref:DsbE family thiol:disulfide interchange protein n=1 Tax=Idiomarina tyrosinivorans TaxID=1445662 RepID=A0A432ZPF8_9GAMM|nr:DsbE family thiol:disulfide interchange protein [Idiomarina tyrosinivorans]RUO79789.1 DsbE family thiol:disulfide interchange protein [Idiomarina tyrosinivorans]